MVFESGFDRCAHRHGPKLIADEVAEHPDPRDLGQLHDKHDIRHGAGQFGRQERCQE